MIDSENLGHPILQNLTFHAINRRRLSLSVVNEDQGKLRHRNRTIRGHLVPLKKGGGVVTSSLSICMFWFFQESLLIPRRHTC